MKQSSLWTSSSSDTDLEAASFEVQSHRGDDEAPTTSLTIAVDLGETNAQSTLPVFLPVESRTALELLETKFGITIDEATNKLVSCTEGKNPYFSFSSTPTTASQPKLPAELVSLIQDLVVQQLLQRKELDLEMVTVPLPTKSSETETSEWKRATAIMCSRNALEHPGRLLLVIPGLNSAGGLWSVSLCLLDSSSPSCAPGDSEDETISRLSLQQASVASCVNLARLNGFAVVVLNPNRSYRYRQRTDGEMGFEIRVINDSKASHREEHLLAVGDHFLINAKASAWGIIGHSAAGKTVIDWMARLSERATKENQRAQKDGLVIFDDAFLLHRLAAVALADANALRLPSALSSLAVKFWQGNKSGIYASQLLSRVANWKANDSLPLDAPLSLNNNTGRSDTKEGFKSARCVLRSAGISNHSLAIIKAVEPMISWLCQQVEDFETLSVSPLEDRPENIVSLASSSTSGGSSSTCVLQ